MSSITYAYAQHPQLATYRETAQVLVDEKIQNQTTAFITLSSTSPLEMRVPTDLDEKIDNTANVTAVAITNANSCVEGVSDQTCVIITITSPSLIESYNITKIQTVSRAIGDTLINNINKAFLLNASFWSVYVQPKGELSSALGTSGALQGNRTIEVVYVAPQLKSSYLFDQLTSLLIPTQIRDAGGFYDVAKIMANSANSSVTFAITPTTNNNQSLYQLQVSTHIPIKGKVTEIRPLDFFGVSQLNKSSYFSGGFFPLNSLFQLSVLSGNYTTAITNHGGNTVPTNNQGIPTDLTRSGWVFDPGTGPEITGIYLFGTAANATNDDLTVTVGTTSDQVIQPLTNSSGTSIPSKTSFDYSIYVVIGIVIAGGAAVYLFMKRR
ncbi:MAG: hypothetical protein ACREBB_01140 [Nitrosotalea sp.]